MSTLPVDVRSHPPTLGWFTLCRVDAHTTSPDAAQNFLSFVSQNVESSYAQLCQDLWVAWMLGPNPGYFIEIGGFDGVTLSNTYLLEQQGWGGLLVEPLPEHFANLDAVRHCDKWQGAIGFAGESGAKSVNFRRVTDAPELSRLEDVNPEDAHEETRLNHSVFTTPLRRLDDLLDEVDAPQVVDYFSLDTEGSELDILATFPFHERTIRVLTVEHNTDARQREITEFLARHGYVAMFPELSRWDGWYRARDLQPVAAPMRAPEPPIKPAPDARNGQVWLAISMFDAGMAEEARRVVDVAGPYVGENVGLLRLHLALAKKSGDPEAIGLASAELARVKPELVGPTLQAAAWKQSQGDIDAAMDLLNACPTEHPNIETRKGNLFAIQADHDQALYCFDAALSLDEASAVALMGKARSLRTLGRLAEARDLLRDHSTTLDARPNYLELVNSIENALAD